MKVFASLRLGIAIVLVTSLSAALCGCSVPMRVPKGRAIKPEHIPAGVEIVKFAGANGVPLEGWWLPIEEPSAGLTPEQVARWRERAKTTVIFCHGADDNANTIMSATASEYGYRVFTFDYRGFGNSPRLLTTNRAMMGDAIGAWEHVRCDPRVQGERIVVMGHSMGAGYALAIAAHAKQVGDPVAAVVAMSGFSTWRYAASGFVPFWGYIVAWADGEDPVDWAQRLKGTRLLITHALGDDLVHYNNAARLKEAARRGGAKVTKLTMPDGGHAFAYLVDPNVIGYMVWWLDVYGAGIAREAFAFDESPGLWQAPVLKE